MAVKFTMAAPTKVSKVLLQFLTRKILPEKCVWQLGNVYHKNISTAATPEANPVAVEKKAEVEKKRGASEIQTEETKLVAPASFRFVYPEFLPDPKLDWRNKVREKLERMDMLRRRSQMEIPEFYVGSIMSVTVSDPHALGKTSRFVGICIQRGGCGLRAWFILRNVVDNQGVEIMYEMYNPTIQKIQVLRLEKRMDEQLLYLRDALPEYSTFSFDLEPEVHPEGAPIPVNQVKVKLKPRPWLERWERQDLKGIQDLGLPERFYKRAVEVAKPWEKYDLMQQYRWVKFPGRRRNSRVTGRSFLRSTVPEEEQNEVYADVHLQLRQMEVARRKAKRKRVFSKPKKTM